MSRHHSIEPLEPRRLLSATTTINAAAPIANATTNPTKVLGVNLAYWDDQLSTVQTRQMVQAAGLNEFRFPGGSAADGYHFTSSDNYYSGENTVSQFAQFIESAGGTGVVSLDYGSGSPQESEAELAYLVGAATDSTVIGSGLQWSDSANAWQTVNFQSVSYWASLRGSSPLATDDGMNFLRVSHPLPFAGISSWEVGNEVYGSWETDHHGTAGPTGSTGAQHDPSTYAAFAAAFASFVAADQSNLPSLLIGIDSDDPTGADYGSWTRNVLSDGTGLGFVPNFISDHWYVQEPGTESDGYLLNSTVSLPSSIADWTTRYTDYKTLLQQTIGTSAQSVQIIATEFNSVSYDPGKQTTSLVNGLFVADSLGGLLISGYSGGYVWDLRNNYENDGNNSSSLYGWRTSGDYGLIGDPNTSSPPATGPYVPYPTYFAEQLVSKIATSGGQAVSTSTNVTSASVYAIRQSSGHLDLLVINKSPTTSLTDQFNITGFTPSGSAQVWQYGETQDNAQSHSSTGASALANSTATLSLTGKNFSYTFPAYSMTVLDISQTVAAVGLSGSNYLEMDKTVAGQVDVWSGTSNAGLPGKTYQLTQISSLTDSGTSGSDTLTIDLTNGDPLAVATTGITFNVTGVTGGADAVAIIGDADADTAVVSSNQMLLSGGVGTSLFTAVPVVFANVAFESIQAGIGTNVLSVAGTTAVNYIAPVGVAHPTAVLSTLSIAAGSKVVFNSPNSNRALLELGAANSWSGQLDLKTNDMLVHGGALATVNAQVMTGFANGTWAGLGITSSAAANNTSYLTALGTILNTAGISFDGAPILTTDVLVKYTYYGDTNLDGAVDGSDYNKIDNGYENHLPGWANGDFNGDTLINGSDYTLIDNTYNTQGTAFSASIGKAARAQQHIAVVPNVSQTQSVIIFATPSDAMTEGLLQKKDRLDALV